MIRTLLVGPRAESDLIEIWLWTRDHFGEAQADRYLDELDAAMRACAAEPQSGKDRQTLRPGYRSRRVGSHIIFYAPTAERVLIHRVLHGSMDFDEHLPR